MGIRISTVKVTTVGSAGSATGAANSQPLLGWLIGVEIDYRNSVPNTTTVDIDEILADLGGGTYTLGRKILDKSASNTDTTHYPHAQAENNAGVGLTFDGTRIVPTPFAFGGRSVRVSVAASDAADPAVMVRLIMEV